MNERNKELAVKCRLLTKHTGGIYTDSLQEFADLIRADEREWIIKWIRNNYQDHNIASLCDAIRAKGNT